jgi:hypothetical protein
MRMAPSFDWNLKVMLLPAVVKLWDVREYLPKLN